MLAGAAAYGALAVYAWGRPAEFFSRPPLAALIAMLMAAAVVSLFAGGNISSGVREDRSNRWVLAAFSIIGLADAYVPAYTDRIGFWTFGGEGVRWAGVVLATLGGALRLWPVFVLGPRFSGLVAIQPGHTLVTTGIYGVIRHPSYVGLLVNSFGWDLAFRSGAGLALSALLIPPLVARMNAEEKLLASQFGSEYERYRARTWRMIPGMY